ncbi:MAG: porin family protein [Bacteroidota bacterium]
MNKRVFLSIMMAVAISFAANAQNDGESKFHFGLKASPSYNWMKTDGTGLESDGGSIGLSYGLMTEFAISKNYAFATGLEITYRGGKYNFNSVATGNVSFKQKLQYVEVPIGLKLKTNEIGYIKYYGLFGILPGVLVKAKQDVDFESTLFEDKENNGNQSNYYAFNVHLNVGAGIEYNLGGNTSFTAGIHYNNGLMDIYKGSDDVPAAQFRTDGIILNVGIFF